MADIDGIEVGTYGIYTFDFEHLSADEMRVAIREVEAQGWRAFWFPELLGREAMTHAAYLLACTERLTVINAIAQVWSREPVWTQGAAVLLADAYPGRHVLGLGFGGAPKPGTTPLRAMREYLDAMDAADGPNPAPAAPMRRLLAAYGPKMLALARDRTAGTLTYHVTVAHTAEAREILGPDAFLGVEHPVLFESDPVTARRLAREHLVPYLSTPYNLAKFRRLGYSERDLSDGGSDRLIDDLVFWGDAETIAGKLAGHVEAGADHVAVQVLHADPVPGLATTVSRWQELSEVLVPTGAPRR